MKKRIIALFAIVATLVSCDVSKELSGVASLINCKYSYNSITNMSVAGINLANGSGLSLTTIPKITSILNGTATSIPLNFTLNLDVNNPNQSAALLHGMQYIISIDGIDFTSGSMTQSLNIGSGETRTLPLTIGLDLASLMKTNSKDAVVDIAKNFIGIGDKESNVTVKIRPSFMVNNAAIASPVYIPVSFSFGGK